MKISKTVLILSGAGLGLALVYSEQGKPNCTPNKAQLILRQKMAELNSGAAPAPSTALPGKAELLGDVERLHNEQKISDQQFDAFKKNINEQYVAPAGPANSEAQAKALKVFEQKTVEPNAAQNVAPPPAAPKVQPQPAPTPVAQAKAEPAPAPKAQQPQPAPSQTETETAAQQILRQKIAELNAGQNATPPPAAPQVQTAPPAPKAQAKAEPVPAPKVQAKPAPAPKAQAKVEPAPAPKVQQPQPAPSQTETETASQQILRQKIAELNAAQNVTPAPAAPKVQVRTEPVPPPKVAPQTEVAQQAVRAETAQRRTQERTNVIPEKATLTPEQEASARELLRMKIAGAKSESPNKPEPQVVPNAEGQAKALAVLDQQEAELKAGVTPDTPEPTRTLRLKIAELKGIIPPGEATKLASAPPTRAATPATQVAAAPPTSPSPSLLTFQTSNKVGLARLQELTALYKADRVTPYEYHHERAKIVASL